MIFDQILIVLVGIAEFGFGFVITTYGCAKYKSLLVLQ